MLVSQMCFEGVNSEPCLRFQVVAISHDVWPYWFRSSALVSCAIVRQCPPPGERSD